MKSKTVAKVVTLYSIVLGALFVLSTILGENENKVISIIIGFTIIILGIIGLTYTRKTDSHIEKPFMITLFVLYCIFEFLSLFVLFIPLFGMQLFIMLQALLAVPFSFCIVYLVRLSREISQSISHSKTSVISDFMDSTTEVTNDFERKINALKKLKEEGLISEEEFRELLSKHLHQNI